MTKPTALPQFLSQFFTHQDPDSPLHAQDPAHNFYRVFKKPGVHAFLVLVAIALVIGAVFQALTPPTVRITQTKFLTTNQDGGNSTFSNVRYVGPEFTPPKELVIASTAPSDLTNKDVENKLITKFDLSPAREPKNLWVGIDFYLSFDVRQNRYLLQSQFAPNIDPAAQKIVTKTDAIAAAQEFLQDIFPDTQLAPLSSELRYYSEYTEHYTEVSELNAQQIQIPFAYLVDGYPVLYGKQSEFPFLVRVSSDNQVQQISFAPQFLTFTPLQKAALISPAQALSNINDRNLGSLVKAQNRAVDDLQTGIIQSGEMTQISIEYRLDPDLRLVFPFYRFDGTITNRDGALLDASIVTPAVATTTQ